MNDAEPDSSYTRIRLIDRSVIVACPLTEASGFLNDPDRIAVMFQGVRMSVGSTYEVSTDRFDLSLLRMEWSAEDKALAFDAKAHGTEISGYLTLRGTLEGTEIWVHLEMPDLSSNESLAAKIIDVVEYGLRYMSMELGLIRSDRRRGFRVFLFLPGLLS